LKREDSKIDEQICLYRRMSNGGLVFRDGNGDEQKQYQQVTKSAVSIEDDDSNIESDFKQSSSLTSTSTNTLREEKKYSSDIQLETLLLNELTTCTTYQSPLQATMILDRIPACVLILINRLSTMSIKQIASLALKARKSDSTNLWQYKSSLNITLFDTIRNVQDHQGLSLVFLDFVD
jgi:hypothetical protein